MVASNLLIPVLFECPFCRVVLCNVEGIEFTLSLALFCERRCVFKGISGFDAVRPYFRIFGVMLDVQQ